MDSVKVKSFTPNQNHSNTFPGHWREKEITSGYRVLDSDFNEIIDCRVYMGRSSNASMVYALVWVHYRPKQIYADGYGSAGGYGYHKKSGAIDNAMNSAGFQFNYGFGGSGDTAVREALLDAARKVSGKRKVHLVEFYP